jgi:hypothetical protein
MAMSKRIRKFICKLLGHKPIRFTGFHENAAGIYMIEYCTRCFAKIRDMPLSEAYHDTKSYKPTIQRQS